MTTPGSAEQRLVEGMHVLSHDVDEPFDHQAELIMRPAARAALMVIRADPSIVDFVLPTRSELEKFVNKWVYNAPGNARALIRDIIADGFAREDQEEADVSATTEHMEELIDAVKRQTPDPDSAAVAAIAGVIIRTSGMYPESAEDLAQSVIAYVRANPAEVLGIPALTWNDIPHDSGSWLVDGNTIDGWIKDHTPFICIPDPPAQPETLPTVVSESELWSMIHDFRLGKVQAYKRLQKAIHDLAAAAGGQT